MKIKFVITLFSLVLFFGISSCQKNEVPDLSEKLSQDKDFISFVNYGEENTRLLLTNQIDPKEWDLAKMNQEYESLNSSEEFYSKLEQSGKKGVREYVKNLKLSEEAMIRVIKKYPDLGKINKEELAKIYEIAIQKVKIELNQDLNQLQDQYLKNKENERKN